MPAAVYEGAGYRIAIPEKGWQQYEEESWAAEVNEDVKIWITDYTGETLETIHKQLRDSGYMVSEEDSNFLTYTDQDGLVWNAALFAQGERIVGVFYHYPEEATEGFGTRLAKIAGSFTWTDTEF